MKKTEEQVRYNMQRVRSKDTEIEILLRKRLWATGLRYRKNVKSIIGKPDIVFLKKKVAVFCDSEFWHGYNWEIKKNEIKINRDFWLNKIESNIRRDQLVNQTLSEAGWRIIRLSGKEIIYDTDKCVETIRKMVKPNE